MWTVRPARKSSRADDLPLYYRIVLTHFYRRTGLPVLVNTSFNVHEEPIIDTPEQALPR